jgi:hypothetical protein
MEREWLLVAKGCSLGTVLSGRVAGDELYLIQSILDVEIKILFRDNGSVQMKTSKDDEQRLYLKVLTPLL